MCVERNAEAYTSIEQDGQVNKAGSTPKHEARKALSQVLRVLRVESGVARVAC